jgi:hypothetical protein
MAHPADILVLACILVAVLLVKACRTTRRPPEVDWFLVYRLGRISKKAKGRGDVNRDGLTRREQAHR